MKITALIVAVALTAAGVPHTGPASTDQLPDAATIGRHLRAGHEGLVTLVAGKNRARALFAQARALDALVPKDTFDLSAIVSQVGRQPARLHQWVHRQTTWVPYRGTLRGAGGTLMDRKGNSLDRSLLLAGLLAAADVPVRLAHAELSDEQVAALQRVKAPAIEKAGEPQDAGRRLLATIDDFAKQTGGDAVTIQQELVRTLESSRTASDNVRKRVDVQTARVMTGLGMTASETAGSLAASDLESLKDHWWVQRQAGEDWSDLDPALADAGVSVGTAQETMEVDALPAELRHRVQVRVMVERSSDSTLEQQEVLSVDIVPSEILGESIRLQHVPMAWPQSLDGPASGLQQRFTGAALSQHEWLPVLTIGSRQVTGASILDTGDVNQQPGSKAPAIAAAAGSFADAFGGGDASPGLLTGEWIEYEIQTPGQDSRVLRREVFDVVGPAARAAGKGPRSLTDSALLLRALGLLTETEILPLSCQVSTAFIQHLTSSRLLAVEPALTDAMDGRAQPDRLEKIAPLPGLLHNFAVARGPLSTNPGSVYLRSINLVSRHTFPLLAPDGTLHFATAIDIVANEVASTAATPAAQFKARLEHGVLDTNLEAVLIGPAAAGGTVADLFGLGEQGRRWIAVRTADDLAKLPAPPDIRARIDADLQAGFAVFAVAAGPTDPVGWWRVDPRTGDTLSLGNRGWGQGMVEYKLVAASVGTFSMCSVGAYVVNGAYTARDRAICALAGLGTLAGGAGLPIVPMFGVTMSYSSLFFSTTVFSGLPVTIAAGTLLAVLADALVWGW